MALLRHFISIRRGLSHIEILIAISILSLSIVGSIHITFASKRILNKGELYQELKSRALSALLVEKEKPFNDLHSSSSTSEYIHDLLVTPRDNYTQEIKSSISSHSGVSFEVSMLQRDFDESRAQDNCAFNLKGNWEDPQIVGKVDIGIDNEGTGIVVRNKKAYLTADSAVQSKEDFFVISIENPEHPHILSKINTGPGIRAITQTGRYAYAGNTSINAQLQIIDVMNVTSPFVAAEFKLPHTDASTTPGVARSIYLSDDVIYLGTNKNTGRELHVIDVSNPLLPSYVSGIEVDTQISAIDIAHNLIYLATPTFHQFRVFDSEDLSTLNALSLSGWQSQEGKSIVRFIDNMYIGRSVGGFNNVDNHEVFSFRHSTSTPLAAGYSSVDIASSVNAIVVRPPYVYLGTSDPAKEFQVRDLHTLSPVSHLNLNAPITDLTCGGDYIFASVQESEAFVIIGGNYE